MESGAGPGVGTAVAVELSGDDDGKVDLEVLANAPRTARDEQQLRERRLLASLDLP